MEIFQIIILFVIALPLLIGARFRALKEKNEKNAMIGIVIQIFGMLGTCVYVAGIILENTIAFYVCLGISLFLYLLCFIYIYIKYIKKTNIK